VNRFASLMLAQLDATTIAEAAAISGAAP